MASFIKPNWPAPKNVKAFTTVRTGGVSVAPYDSFNLAEHVDDNPNHISKNRSLLIQNLDLPSDPIWIQQTHSTIVLEARPENTNKEADATYTNQLNRICIVQTADCLPVLLCHRQGTHVAAIHAGWRGLANGIIEEAIRALNLPNNEDLLTWFGPAISVNHFEVGDEVRNIFITQHTEASAAFTPSPNQRWMGDLYALARIRLEKLGVKEIYGGEYCTYSNNELFYSYRRDGSKTGRMASLIWIDR